MIGGAGKGQGMGLHLHQQFVHHRHLPGLLGARPVPQESLRLVDDQERVLLARLLERARDVPLGLADPFRQQVGAALQHRLQPHCARELAGKGALARSGRAIETKRDIARRTRRGQGGLQPGQIDIRVRQFQREGV
jgi:hypothetical protein